MSANLNVTNTDAKKRILLRHGARAGDGKYACEGALPLRRRDTFNERGRRAAAGGRLS